MTNSPPPDPQPSPRNPLGFDEFIAIFVAFTTIGTILFWSISQRNPGFQITGILPLSPSPSPADPLSPNFGVTQRERAPVLPVLPVLPIPIPPVDRTESPEVESPVPPQTPTRQRTPRVIPAPITTPTTPIRTTPAPAQPINFVDVPDDFWARPFIQALAARDIVNGFPGGYFRPDQPVTRAEFAALLQEAFTQGPGASTVQYKDVPSDFWAVPAIARATTTGFLEGYPGNIFRPTQEIPRVQVLVALASGLKLPVPSAPANVLRLYNDANQIPNYAIEEVAAATAAGLVVNYPNPQLLNPNRNATRAEVAAIIYQALVQAGRAEPIQSQYIIQTVE